jgi:osmotically-inducible protein OsmY
VSGAPADVFAIRLEARSLAEPVVRISLGRSESMKPIVSDKSLRDAVMKELEDDQEVAAKHIWVTAIDGAVTLAGHVMTIHEKRVAVRAAERVPAVRAVADDIEVRAPSLHELADDEIAEEIAHLRSWGAEIPDSVAVQVRGGRVILHGQVESESQRDAAESAVRQLTGVRVVDNLIMVTPPAEPTAADPSERGGGQRGGIFLVARFRAPDYARMKRAFDDLQPLRERYGARSHRILRLADDPEDYIVIIDFASSGGAHGFTKDPILLSAIDAAGIEGGAHHVQYLEEFREQLEAVEYTF